MTEEEVAEKPKKVKAPKAAPIDVADTPERLALIEAIREGRAKGSLEEHPKWGTLIIRTALEAREYDEALANERHRVAQASKKHDFKRRLYSNLKG